MGPCQDIVCGYIIAGLFSLGREITASLNAGRLFKTGSVPCENRTLIPVYSMA